MGALRQFLDRHRDALGQEKAEPHRREQDQECHDRKGNHVGYFDGSFQQFYLLEFFQPLRKGIQSVNEGSRYEFFQHNQTDHRLRLGPREDGDDSANQVSMG